MFGTMVNGRAIGWTMTKGSVVITRTREDGEISGRKVTAQALIVKELDELVTEDERGEGSMRMCECCD